MLPRAGGGRLTGSEPPHPSSQNPTINHCFLASASWSEQTLINLILSGRQAPAACLAPTSTLGIKAPNLFPTGQPQSLTLPSVVPVSLSHPKAASPTPHLTPAWFSTFLRGPGDPLRSAAEPLKVAADEERKIITGFLKPVLCLKQAQQQCQHNLHRMSQIEAKHFHHHSAHAAPTDHSSPIPAPIGSLLPLSSYSTEEEFTGDCLTRVTEPL